MRMWAVDPKIMCQKHILGEHVEMHHLLGWIRNKKNLKGFVERGLVETHNIIKRHDELVEEIIRRGMNHNSPLDEVELPIAGSIDRNKSLQELLSRCPECRRNYNGQA